jgi:catechol 2,3-dioxygenase-like lactoylglutathione lyase family enzyme
MATLRHVAYIVQEPKKLYDYYHHLFGVEQVRLSPTGSIHVVDGLFNLAFLQKQAVDTEVVGTHRADGTEANQTLGINHFGFMVEKLDEVLGKLDESIVRGENPQNGRPAEMRVIDPWGNNFDLSSRGFLAKGERTFPGVRHVAINATDPEATARFYEEKLDLRRAAKNDDGSILLDDGDVSILLTPQRPIGRPGIQYVGVRVDDWNETEARFEDLGIDLPSPKSGEHEVRLTDPEGNLYVLSERGWTS